LKRIIRTWFGVKDLSQRSCEVESGRKDEVESGRKDEVKSGKRN
jgi:hypothetical protein